VTASPFSSRELVGLLADDARRRVFAALVLGAADAQEVLDRSGLDARVAGKALQRLEASGLVIRGDDGTLHLLGEAFALAARAAAERDPASDEHSGETAERARVLRAFVHGGRMISIPAVHAKRLVVLDWIAQRFEPGRRYPEPTVNLVLSGVYPDVAALRRHLVDDGFLARDRGIYWRTGGTYEP
jgi:hypothetical protein